MIKIISFLKGEKPFWFWLDSRYFWENSMLSGRENVVFVSVKVFFFAEYEQVIKQNKSKLWFGPCWVERGLLWAFFNQEHTCKYNFWNLLLCSSNLLLWQEFGQLFCFNFIIHLYMLSGSKHFLHFRTLIISKLTLH